MSHPLHRVTSFEQFGSHTLRISFADGVTRTIDFTPILKGELFGPLQDPTLFAQVQLDPDAHTLLWPNGADFDPATLHDWPRHEAAIRAATERWTESHALK